MRTGSRLLVAEKIPSSLASGQRLYMPQKFCSRIRFGTFSEPIPSSTDEGCYLSKVAVANKPDTRLMRQSKLDPPHKSAIAEYPGRECNNKM
jgi:hypothetical protein